MKKAIFLICFAIFVQSAFSAPLVFKTTKAVSSSEEFVELFTLDTAKFHDLRVHIKGSIPNFDIVVYAVEGEDSLRLFHESGLLFVSNAIIPIPSAKIRVDVRGKGTFKAFVWAQ